MIEFEPAKTQLPVAKEPEGKILSCLPALLCCEKNAFPIGEGKKKHVIVRVSEIPRL